MSRTLPCEMSCRSWSAAAASLTAARLTSAAVARLAGPRVPQLSPDLVAQLDHPARTRGHADESHRAARQAPIEERLSVPEYDRNHGYEHLVEKAFVGELGGNVSTADDPQVAGAGGAQHLVEEVRDRGVADSDVDALS